MATFCVVFHVVRIVCTWSSPIWGFGWVNKVNRFWSARPFGAVWFEARLFQGMSFKCPENFFQWNFHCRLSFSVLRWPTVVMRNLMYENNSNHFERACWWPVEPKDKTLPKFELKLKRIYRTFGKSSFGAITNIRLVKKRLRLRRSTTVLTRCVGASVGALKIRASEQCSYERKSCSAGGWCWIPD